MWELLLGLAILLASCLPLVLSWMGRPWFGARQPVILIPVCVLALLGMILLAMGNVDLSPTRPELPENRPITVSSDGYVSSQTCRSCHPQEHRSWHESYHRTMTQIANPETVVGDFDDQLLILHGREYFLHREGDKFICDMDMPGWDEYLQQNPQEAARLRGAKPPSFRGEIVMTTGSHHMQAYWYATKRSRMVAPLPFVYLIDQQKWIPADASFLNEPSHSVAAEFGRWNTTCLKCHSTHPRARIASQTEMDTEVGEFGIACEACHGPGEEHVKANRNPKRRYSLRLLADGDPTIVNPARLNHELSSQVCGHCHSVTYQPPDDELRWREKGNVFRPGDASDPSRVLISREMGESHLKKLLGPNPHYLEDRFWADGMCRVSGREYNGLIRTPCFQKGTMSCLSCHSLHNKSGMDSEEWTDDQLQPEMRTNAACIKCHKQLGDDASLTAHTHHEAGSSGSLCYNCHMPYTTYGLQKAIRSHQIDSPDAWASLNPPPEEERKGLTREAGRPNACNQCHLDQTLGWTASHLDQWYGQEPPKLTKEQQELSAAVLWALRGDAGQRALMAWSFGWETAGKVANTDWMVPMLAYLMDDPYESVRLIAHRSLRRIPGYEHVDYDFVGEPEHRRAARDRVIKQWAAQKGHRPLARVLIRDDGTLDVEKLEQLLKNQNGRRVNLAE